jgi:O-antigen/teichoic acid export membrane protein
LDLGLVWGQLLGQFLATSVSVISSRSFLQQLKYWDKSEIISIAKTYSNFPKYQLPHSLLNMFAGNLPVLLLSLYFEMERIGLFSLALTVGFAPVMLFSNSVYQVLFRNISERIQKKEKIRNDCFLFFFMCLIVILPFFILAMFIPNRFFTILFGIEWTSVGFYLKCMLPWLFLVIINASLCCIPDIFFRQKTAMMIEIIFVALRIVVLLVGAYFQNFNLAVGLFCSVSALMMGVRIIWYLRLINKYETAL